MVIRSRGFGAVVALAGFAVLAACEKEVILEGERFPVRAPLEASVPVEGQAAPVAPDPKAGYVAAPISLPGMQNGDWAQRGGNAAHTGYHGSLSASPQRVWSAAVGQGNAKRARMTAAPVVSGNQVFAMDAGMAVAAFSLGGAAQWKVALTPEFDRGGDAAAGGGLAVAGNRVFATTGFGEVVALNAADGAVVWRQRLDAPVSGAPAVDGGKVFVVARDGTAMALDGATGKVVWSVTGSRALGGVLSPASPAVADGRVILPFATGQVIAADVAEGARQWTGAVAGQRVGRAVAGLGDVTGDPVVSGGVVYVGASSGRTVAIDAETGQRLWFAPEGAMNAPLVVGGSVFMVNDEARLVRLEAATGAVVWATDMPLHLKEKPKKWRDVHAHYGPVLAGGRLVVASSDGVLRLFDPTNGALVATAEIPGGGASAPVLAGGMLLVMGGNGQIHAFR